MCYNRHHQSWPYEEVFFTFGEYSISVTIEDCMKKFLWPSVNVLSSAPPVLTIWRSFLHLRWVFYQRHHHWRLYEEVSLAIGECVFIGTTSLDHIKKFSSPSVSVLSASPPLKIVWRSFLGHRWMCYNRRHQSWPYEEVFFVFGVCFFLVTTIEDHLKKLSWPSVNVLSSAPPFLTIWRNVLHLQGRRRSFDILAINHSSFFWRRYFSGTSTDHCIFLHYLLQK